LRSKICVVCVSRSNYIPVDPGAGGGFDVKGEVDWDDAEDAETPSIIAPRNLWDDMW